MTVALGTAFASALEKSFKEHSDCIAIDCGDQQISYAALLSLTQKLSRPELVLELANSLELIVHILSAVLRNETICPLNMRLPASERQRLATQVSSSPSYAGPFFFTSGSSDTPKAAVLSWDNVLHSALASQERVPVGPGTRWLLSLPLYHVGGLGVLARCFLHGATVCLPQPGTRLSLDLLHRHHITQISLVPTQLGRLLREDGPLPAKHSILLGGAAAPESLIEKCIQREWPIQRSYGLTEMASQVTTTQRNASPKELKSSGASLPHARLSFTEQGEILVDGPSLFTGYLKDSELEPATRPFPTGDLGYLDEAGYLHVTGRKDFMIISGGENIQPEELERVLCDLPTVDRACVVPVSHADYGQRPVAFVSTHDSATLPQRESLLDFLPGYKCPDYILAWPSDLQNTMKPPRRTLMDRAAALVQVCDGHSMR